MAETRTEITVNVYAGVPFNTKYQNVLFVDKQTRDLFLHDYEIGSEITVGRFDIINDNQAIIDISNEYGTMSVNYIKVHKTLRPESSNSVFEYDLFYFVDHTQQLATNAVRLFLDLDIFQTYFVKYNYQTESYEIPQLKNSRCEISTDFSPNEKFNINEMTNFNNNYYYTPLFDNATNEIYVVFNYTENNGYTENCGVIKLPTYVFGDGTIDSNHYRLVNIIHALQNGKLFVESYETTIQINKIFFIPKNIFSTSDIPVYYSRFYLKDNLDADFEVDFYPFNAERYQYYISKYKDISIDNKIQTSVGNFEKQIELPFNSKNYIIELKIIIGESFQVLLLANNQSIDLTYSFEMSLLFNSYTNFMNSHENSIAVKGISHAINLLSSIGSIASGNPTGVLSTTNTIKNIADDISTFADLKKQPSKLLADKNITSSFLLFNMIGVFYNRPSNSDEIEKISKYYGYKMNYLTSKTFEFMPTNSNKNFDYYKFSNVEIIGKLQESFKTRFEQMFLNGVRIWYSTTNFLDTIENTES